MKFSRQDFLKLTGASVIAAAGERLLVALPGQAASTTPAAGTARRLAMAIDVTKCLKEEDCTKCMAACDQAHNIPHILQPNREVKWIWKTRFEDAFGEEASSRDALREQAIPVFCNHCDDPSCVRVCPTQATWKRGDGIVMMDWHRCIGCRYCMAACPYGSRSFNWMDPRPYIAHINPEYPTRTKGVVEKCTFCEERLAKKQPPACVEVCPAKALVFGDLNDAGSPLRQLLRAEFNIRRRPELGTRPSVFYIV